MKVAMAMRLFFFNLFKTFAGLRSSIDVRNMDDQEFQHGWSISARLAALSPDVVAQLPLEVAGLVAEAQGLHPEVASAAAHRVAESQN